MKEEIIKDAWTIDLRHSLNNEVFNLPEGSVKAVDLPFKEKLPYKIGTHFIFNPPRKEE